VNNFKYNLGRKTQYGLWQALASPYSAEICAGSGFDFLVFDGEHAPNTLPLILQQLQAVAPYPVEALVRLADDNRTGIKHYLDIGARSLLVPMIESVEQAQAVVAATRYPPEGTRGVGAGLARVSRWNRIPDYLNKASEEICLILQVESRAGLAIVEDLAVLDGVDAIFVGPADLAADMGYLGRPAHPDVHAAVTAAIKSIVAGGCSAGVMTLDRDMARQYQEAGASMLAVATDVALLARGAEAAIIAFREEIG
jgi:4-hydroxy-2-oxoheptanedioate aldolase